MSKVFTITEGLENMGAMKTGGQGSVYKGRRIGEIVTAIKLLPTPIHSESEDDKNFTAFSNEVQKLKRVNENPNPNVVKILSSGITDTGNLPFIEMEYIEGPDLQDLLNPPHDPIFTIKEALKVAEQLSNALAHCHQLDVKHGDIKSNNVKLNINTGNYILLDFGLSVMSDESRRTSLQRAGAIEFMAPEQNEGAMLFQTDVYSFGVILFELLAGQVPFPLHNRGESARNEVRLSHMETPVPDMLALRAQHMPAEWSEEATEREMLVPEWLTEVVYKCLSKDPANRFENGVELHDHISLHRTQAIKHDEAVVHQSEQLLEENGKLEKENTRLIQAVRHYKEQVISRDKDIRLLKQQLSLSEEEINQLNQRPMPAPVMPQEAPVHTDDLPPRKGVSKGAFFGLMLVTIALAIFTIYSLFNNNNAVAGYTDSTSVQPEQSAENTIPISSSDTQANSQKIISQIEKEPGKETAEVIKPTTIPKEKAPEKKPAVSNDDVAENETTANKTPVTEPASNSNDIGSFKVRNKAFFHNAPDKDTRRNAFIVHWNNAVLKPTDEKNGFVYVVFTNHLGQTSKGWLNKSELVKVGG